MAIDATLALLTTSYGLTPSRRAGNSLFETLSQSYAGTFDPSAAPSVASALLDLTAIDESGQSRKCFSWSTSERPAKAALKRP